VVCQHRVFRWRGCLERPLLFWEGEAPAEPQLQERRAQGIRGSAGASPSQCALPVAIAADATAPEMSLMTNHSAPLRATGGAQIHGGCKERDLARGNRDLCQPDAIQCVDTGFGHREKIRRCGRGPPIGGEHASSHRIANSTMLQLTEVFADRRVQHGNRSEFMFTTGTLHAVRRVLEFCRAAIGGC
jgi:hypothetical protein